MDTPEMLDLMIHRVLKRVFWLPLLACVLSGCSSFSRDWRANETGEGDPVAGLWQGTWLSDANGHHGGLRCIMTPQDNEIYAARYRASYMRILRFEYTVPMRVRTDGDAYTFKGDADLGEMAGGFYTYTGSITGRTFRAKYNSKRDWGVFEMERGTAR